jgi:hypothetical protein
VSHYQEYKYAFDTNRAALHIPGDCTCKPPIYRPHGGELIDPKSWDFSWWLEFTDNHYIVCHEIWSYRVGKKPTRHYLSFHYGPIARRDSNGNIDRDSNNPLIIRICRNNKEPAHLHYKNPHPAPHFEQSQVDGLVLEEADMFPFVRAVFRARAEKIELSEALGFITR